MAQVQVQVGKVGHAEPTESQSGLFYIIAMTLAWNGKVPALSRKTGGSRKRRLRRI